MSKQRVVLVVLVCLILLFSSMGPVWAKDDAAHQSTVEPSL